MVIIKLFQSIMIKLIFATNNSHKVKELNAVVSEGITIISLKEAGIIIDIPEPHETLSANATEKSRTIYSLTGLACFGEDSGLEVAALDGEPGVRSARYAGENRSFADNIAKLLDKLSENKNRKARFRTIISLILENKEYLFEGICEGEITGSPEGAGGFGYDPVFKPDGAGTTFAEMSLEDKNKYSHRKKAADKMIKFLHQHYGKDQNQHA
jgi:XTP/dITP diphosphohydrolase